MNSLQLEMINYEIFPYMIKTLYYSFKDEEMKFDNGFPECVKLRGLIGAGYMIGTYGEENNSIIKIYY